MSFARQPHAMLGAGIRCFDLQSGCMQTEAGSASFETAFCRIMHVFSARPLLRPAFAALLALLGMGTTSQAQYPAPPSGYGAPPQPGYGQSQGGAPVCQRLEAQLAMIDRGTGGDPGRTEQIRRYEESAARQSAELERVTAQARRMGCDSSGFFSLFSGQSAQCGPVNGQIQQMRSNLDQITTSLERLRGGGVDAQRENQRRSVIVALAQNNCGPQYVNAARAAQGGGFLNDLFGGNSTPSQDLGPPSSTFRTVCVRTCDGFYFPISFATVPSRFADDERACKNLCPAADATLFTYRNPGEDMNSAVSINGQSYSSLANAFKYRTEFNPSCSCKAQGQTWADALKTLDDKSAAAQNGDIIVTEERAKQMSQPQKGSVAKGKAGAGTKAPVATAPAAQAPATEPAPSANGAQKQIRTVGPTFIPAAPAR